MNMNARYLCFGLMAVATMVLGADFAAYAQDAATAGGNVVDTIQDAVTGNIGVFIGLAIVLLGLWTWIIKQEAGAGVVMILGGVAITMLPGIFNGAKEVMEGVVGTFSGGNVTDARK